jgi:methyl-accepting chemotaxis protein-1 (serine sensor receptor)
MTIRGQLTFAFSLMVGLVLAITMVALNALGDAHDKFESYNEFEVKQNQLISKVRGAISARAIAARNLVLSDVPADREVERLAILQAHQATQEALDKLNAEIKRNPHADPKDVQMVAEMTRIESQYGPIALEITKLAVDGKTAEAIAKINKDCRPLLAELIKVSSVISLSLLDEGGIYTRARTLLMVAAAIAVAAALGMGLLITRSLVGALGGEPLVATDLARAVAEGDLTMSIHVRPGDTTSLMARLKLMQEGLIKVVQTVRQGSDGVATASAEISQANHDLSARTESQASALEETAASMEELSSTVRQNADNASQANQLTINASNLAIQGGAVVAEVVTTMQRINESSKKISDIIGVIDGIAFQTNILALNAAVEAARAGEQGRGFAVVASEVRSLAGRSAEAAKEIKILISASVERVAQGTVLVDKAGATMTEVASAIRRATDIMGEISAASSEQSAGVSQVGEAVTQMDHATQQNAALVEQMAAAANVMRTQAQELVGAVAVFKVGNDAVSLAPRKAVVQPRPVAAPAKTAAPSKISAPVGKKTTTIGAPKRVTAPAANQGDGGDWTAF